MCSPHVGLRLKKQRRLLLGVLDADIGVTTHVSKVSNYIK